MNSLKDLQNFLSQSPYQSCKKFILIDENTFSHCLPELIEEVDALNGAEILEIESGEGSKSLAIVEQLCGALIESGADKSSILISLGGGVITDLGGFIASVFKRGIRHIAIPTTLLAMVDASIGGKTAVNLAEIKNQIGTIYQPIFTAIHFPFLETLDQRQILNGAAEMIKIALVCDSDLWDKMKNHSPIDELGFDEELIISCINLKEAIVEKDLCEKDLRKILNFGHSIGHAFESLSISKGEDLLHGEAVAMGIYYEIRLSELILNFPKDKAKEIYDYLRKYYKIESIKENINEILNYIIADKKNFEDKFQFILLKDIADPQINIPISKGELMAIE